MAHHVIYVPGLGDQKAYGQDIILRLWKIYGLSTHYFPLGWAHNEPFAAKLSRLLAKVDQLQDEGQAVSLVGVSAGASAAVDAYAQRRNINKVILICGKVQNPQTVSRRYFQENPAFEDSLGRVKRSLEMLGNKERGRMLSIRPIWDNTVPVADTKIDGVLGRTVPIIGHIPAIYYSISLDSHAIARFIKS